MGGAIRNLSAGGGRIEMSRIESDVQEKVKNLLKELFQFDTQDLDFGIYRIMNFKRKEIERFIDDDLIAAAEREFKEYTKSDIVGLQKEVDRLRAEIDRDFGKGTIDERGHVLKNQDAPKIKEYMDKIRELESTRATRSEIQDVFNHIYEFFSRYYDKGDFLSKRRYGGREKYYVPYNGEEVLLHWANNDQYYIKTGEYFKKYSFKAGGYRIDFALKEADVEQNNVEVGPKYFLLFGGDSVEFDGKKKELSVFFTWRGLTDEEKSKYGMRDIQRTVVTDIADNVVSQIKDMILNTELQKKADEQRTILEKHLNMYVERNTTDYFIHQDLKSFLGRELDFYLKSEVLDLDEIERMDESHFRMNKAKMRAIRGIGGKVIEFLAQIENFQKLLFEKKKFVVRTEYSVTLDRVPETLWDAVLENKAQIREWNELYGLMELLGKAASQPDKAFLKEHPTLMIDTRYFSDDFKWKLLGGFDDLDNALDGLLFKRDSFQALNLLQEAWKMRLDCVYIDPPFNTAASAILYKNNYKHSSWLSLLKDRIQKTVDLMKNDSIICVAIDDYELPALKYCLSRIFGEDRHLATVAVRSNPHGRAMASGFSTNHEYALFLGKTEQAVIGRLPRDEKGLARYPKSDGGGFFAWINFRGTGVHTRRVDRPKLFYPIYVSNTGEIRIPTMRWSEKTRQWDPLEALKPLESIVAPIDDKKRERVWTLGWERAREEIHSGDVVPKQVDGVWQIYRKYRPTQEGAVPSTWWDAARYSATESGTKVLKDMFGERERFSFPKSVHLVEDCLRASNYSAGSCVLDFFAGSGTTAHAVINLNQDGGKRKYILIEMADYFDTVLLPRIKKAVYCLKWKDGKPVGRKGVSHMVKYHYIEQYEDALNNIVFKEKDKTIQQTLDSFQDYFLRYVLEYETRESPTRLLIEKFQMPFDYKIKIMNEDEEKEQTVDLVETFNYLLGLRVQKLRTAKNGEHTYRIVIGKRNNESIIVIWRNTKDMDLATDRKFIEEKILSSNVADIIFINGDSYIQNASAIEPEFKRLMGA